jgi:hypothetical protein
MIFENGDLFVSVFDKMEPELKKECAIIETLIRNIIQKSNVSVTEQKFVRDEIIKASYSGNLSKIQKLQEHCVVNDINTIKDKSNEILNHLDERLGMIHVSFKSPSLSFN